jgi:hypothetical protein
VDERDLRTARLPTPAEPPDRPTRSPACDDVVRGVERAMMDAQNKVEACNLPWAWKVEYSDLLMTNEDDRLSQEVDLLFGIKNGLRIWTRTKDPPRGYGSPHGTGHTAIAQTTPCTSAGELRHQLLHVRVMTATDAAVRPAPWKVPGHSRFEQTGTYLWRRRRIL